MHPKLPWPWLPDPKILAREEARIRGIRLSQNRCKAKVPLETRVTSSHTWDFGECGSEIGTQNRNGNRD